MRDLRKYAKQTQIRLIIGLLALTFTVGLALIWAFYGTQAALTGLICLGAMLLPVGLILLVLAIIERIVKHDR